MTLPSDQSLEIEILCADLESTKAEWFKQQREGAVREQDYARRLAAAELRADALADALKSALQVVQDDRDILVDSYSDVTDGERDPATITDQAARKALADYDECIAKVGLALAQANEP